MNSWDALSRATPAVLALIAASCGGSGGRIATSAPAPASVSEAQSLRAQLEGEWTLMAMQMGDSASRRVTGFLRYDRFASITLHAELAADEPAARPPQTVVADFTAKASPGAAELEYTGLREGVGADRLTPDAVTMGEWRFFELSGNTLRLFVRDRAGRPAATLVFQRAK